MSTTGTALVAGCGYLGVAVARLLQKAGWRVTGITRSGETAESGIPTVGCDISDPVQVAQLPTAELVIDCVSSSKGGAESYERVYFQGAKNLLELLKPRVFVFTSSTSVYAQTDHSVVNEESLAEPERETGRILRRTEELVLSHGGLVARLAGIYGPGRSVLLRKFLDGTAIIEGEGDRFLNQIHRDDAAAALLLMGTRPLESGIYNVSDDTPIRQKECYQWLAGHFGKPLPPYGPIDLNRKRGWTSKRVCNERLRLQGWRCQHRSFFEAVAAGLKK